MKGPFDVARWRLAHDRDISLGPQAVIMGIVNVTPDSFSDGGDHYDQSIAFGHALHIAQQGAHILDIGGESTRPGAAAVEADCEWERVRPVINRLALGTDHIISIDTYRASTALSAVEAGAHIINDIWGCQKEPDLARVAADTGAGLVIMNNRRDREVLPDPIDDALAYLEKSLEIVRKAGVFPNHIVLDPGFGFATDATSDISILAGLEKLTDLGFPLLIGTSRKRFLGAITGREAKERDVATAATSIVARLKGGAIFRVHDISPNMDALAVADALIAEQADGG